MRRWPSTRTRRFALALCAAVLAGCTATTKGSSTPASTSATAEAATTVTPTVVVDGLSGPTQFTDGPGAWLLVAQLNGDEDARSGQVLAVDPATGKRTVLYEGLDKPTGVAWLDGFVWIMERRRLVRGQWSGARTPGPLSVMVDALAFNGRSEGTLTVTPDHRVLYETSGSLADGLVVKDSGTLWVFDPATKTSAKVATGLKNAYAHVFLPDGRLLSTEIGDSAEPAPIEEVNVLPYSGRSSTPVDAGWPTCPGDRDCDGVVTPIATFAPHTTPTGIAVDSTSAYVALLVTGEIRGVPLRKAGTGRITSTVIASGLQGPHTLLRRHDGALWVSEHFAGRIVAIDVDRR